MDPFSSPSLHNEEEDVDIVGNEHVDGDAAATPPRSPSTQHGEPACTDAEIPQPDPPKGGPRRTEASQKRAHGEDPSNGAGADATAVTEAGGSKAAPLKKRRGRPPGTNSGSATASRGQGQQRKAKGVAPEPGLLSLDPPVAVTKRARLQAAVNLAPIALARPPSQDGSKLPDSATRRNGQPAWRAGPTATKPRTDTPNSGLPFSPPQSAGLLVTSEAVKAMLASLKAPEEALIEELPEEQVHAPTAGEVAVSAACSEFEASLPGLTVARDSIGRATAAALRAGDLGGGAKAVRLVLDAVEVCTEPGARLAYLYLLDSVMRTELRQRAEREQRRDGAAFPRAVGAALARLVSLLVEEVALCGKVEKVLNIWGKEGAVGEALLGPGLNIIAVRRETEAAAAAAREREAREAATAPARLTEQELRAMAAATPMSTVVALTYVMQVRRGTMGTGMVRYIQRPVEPRLRAIIALLLYWYCNALWLWRGLCQIPCCPRFPCCDVDGH